MSRDAAKRARDARQDVLDLFLRAALAGARAMQAAGTGLISFKNDGTPHAAADLASDLAIRAALAEGRPDLPIVSEEGVRALPDGFADRTFILVDPLDGTREFMEGHPDHAVCIALVEHRRPVAGVIAAPARRQAWLAGEEAFELALDESLEVVPGSARRLKLDGPAKAPRLMATSRSRPDPLARRLFPEIGESSLRRIGAVLKLVAIARGEACVFPTQNPSSEWDIAAGDALIRAAGGTMVGRDGKALSYGNADRRFLNEPYVAACSQAVADLALRRWAEL